ncbi:MAG: hypothetical protein A2Z74_04905 [Chloroflexi bacterium RBG_13_46_9]|nr:MAG: hypothetical protein A2Z74_04905 [Chloroflexi bacterium RBG_13_46_9]
MAWKLISSVLSLIVVGILIGCGGTTNPITYSATELKYLLIDKFGEPFYCDPYQYPIAREGQEEQDALAQFASIRSNQEEFSVILKRLNITEKDDYTTAEKIIIFREYNKLNIAITLTATRDKYNFELREGENPGERIEGTITQAGKIAVTKRETVFNTCPICLAVGTLIDTPNGLITVEKLRVGTPIWTTDEVGNRISGSVIDTTKTQVPMSFQLTRITLEDGRSVAASPGHPAANGQALAYYQVGDLLDGSRIISIESVAYLDSATYDILPSGPTGLYWANGILLRSTIGK